MINEEFFTQMYNNQVNGTTSIVSTIKNNKKMAEKQYVNGLIIKEKVFENGGNQLKLSIKTDDMVKQLKELDDNGWVNLIVTRRKEPSDTGITHYSYVDTWKPTKKPLMSETSRKDPMGGINTPEDDLPF
jgi:hypothetical protein